MATLFAAAVTSTAVQHLHSTASWSLYSSSNHSLRVPAKIPGLAHTLLLAAGVLRGDPFFRFNEANWSWVATTSWTFEGTFNVDAGLRGASVLELGGVDTIADISINGKHIGAADNSFITWRFAVDAGLLQSSGNVLTVVFTPPLQVAHKRAAAYPTSVPASVYYHVRQPVSTLRHLWVVPSLLPTLPAHPEVAGSRPCTAGLGRGRRLCEALPCLSFARLREHDPSQLCSQASV